MHIKAKIRVVHLEVRECQRVPVNHQTLGERRRASSPSQPSEEPTLSTPRLQTASLQNCEENKLLLFKEGNLWYFVRAA